MNKNRLVSLALLFSLLIFNQGTPAQMGNVEAVNKTNLNLSAKQKSMVAISAAAAKGDLEKLPVLFNQGLDSGLTVNETKEVLIHLYAYSGFPRSLQGINALMTVLADRKAKGINDELGRKATPLTTTQSKYERGKKNLQTLSGRAESGQKTGYAAFAPEIEIFLKEHLFADIFDRDVLNYQDREIVTISVLSSLGSVDPQLQSHLSIGMNVGLTESQLNELITVIKTQIGEKEASTAKAALDRVLRRTTNTTAQTNTPVQTSANGFFDKGSKAPSENFTGNAWIKMVVPKTPATSYSVGSVTFEPGARTNWHKHPAGQNLMVIDGTGLYQERGQPVRSISKGEAIICAPNTEHWHGASPTSQMTHMTVTNSVGNSSVTWLEPVTDEEYKGQQK